MQLNSKSIGEQQEMNNFAKLQQLLSQSLKVKDKTLVYLFRHAQSLGNHAGSIVGWTDSKLSVKGRQDANKLFRGLHTNVRGFTHYHTSDLSRCRDTFDICTGLSGITPVQTNQLRQLNFGDQQGAHYDSMSEQQKKIINSLDYKPPNGQTWPQARERAMNYLRKLSHGHHFVMTHGGLICALTYPLGIKNVIPNCSMVCVELCPQKKDFSVLKYRWDYL